MEEPKPDFSIEVESPEEESVMMPKIIPKNITLVEKPMEMPVEKPMEMPVEIQDSLEQKQTQLAETIEIENPRSIFPHIEPYPETSPKHHHFQFKHKTDRVQLIQLWNQNGITAELNESGKNNVDVTLMRQDRLIGKIQFLHFDRRDRSVRSKHYVKLYLYQFDDSTMFEKAKQIMRDFFHQIGSRLRHRSPRTSHRVTRRLPHKKTRTTKKHRRSTRK